MNFPSWKTRARAQAPEPGVGGIRITIPSQQSKRHCHDHMGGSHRVMISLVISVTSCPLLPLAVTLSSPAPLCPSAPTPGWQGGRLLGGGGRSRAAGRLSSDREERKWCQVSSISPPSFQLIITYSKFAKVQIDRRRKFAGAGHKYQALFPEHCKCVVCHVMGRTNMRKQNQKYFKFCHLKTFYNPVILMWWTAMA